MFFDIFQVWGQLSVAIGGNKAKDSNTVDHSFITPAIIALGEFSDSNLEELKRLTQGDPVVFWNLGARELPSSCRSTFNNQVIDVQWRSPCQYTKAPVLECVFTLCESVKSWYDLNEKNLSIIHCPQGYPSTGILIACLLKYIGAFEKAEQAYDFYCNKRLRCDPINSLAPSYRTLFDNVDRTVDNHGYKNVHPLHLKTISIAGLPVEDIPCLEVWDLSGKVFGSHVGWKHTCMCTWDAEYGDGYFQVGQNILGDFAITCRFGGQQANTKEKSTLIFKYQNSTAFLEGGKLELKALHVDINPQYEESLEIDTFTMHLAFENVFAEEDTGTAGKGPGGRQQVHALDAGKQQTLPPYHRADIAGFEAGLDELAKIHPVMPNPHKCAAMEMLGCDSKYASVALQLANNDDPTAAQLVALMVQRREQLTVPVSTEDSDGLFFTAPSESDTSAPFTPQKTHPAGIAHHDEELSECNSEDNWEVVDFKCPICNTDNPDMADQVIPCSICARQFHTLCAGLRRIPFSTKTEKDCENREKYMRKHFKDWRCSGCISNAADLNDGSSDVGGQRPLTSRSSVSSGGSGWGRDDVSIASSTLTSSTPGHHRSLSAHSMSVPSSRQNYGVATGGGGVIVTDTVRTPMNATGQPFTPNVGSSSSVASATKPGLKVSVTKAGRAPSGGSLLFGAQPNSPSHDTHSSKSSSPVRSTSADGGGGMFSPPHHPFSPVIKSKNDQMASLMGLLASNGLTAEDLLAMSEEKQKEMLTTMANASTAHSSSHLSSSALASKSEVKQQDLASALKGLIAKNTAKAVPPSAQKASVAPSGDGAATAETAPVAESEPFDARKHMLEIIKRKAAQANAPAPAPVPAPATPTPAQAQGSTSAAGVMNFTPYAPAKEPGAVIVTVDSTGTTILTSAFAKYYKMMKAGIPKHSIAEKLVTEGLIRSEALAMELLSLDPNQRIPDKFFEIPNYDMDRLIPVGKHPHYQKYFKMLKIGLPRDAVKEKVRQDGLDGEMLDKPEDELVPQPGSAGAQGGGGAGYGPGGGLGPGLGPGLGAGLGPGLGPGLGTGLGPGSGIGGGAGSGSAYGSFSPAGAGGPGGFVPGSGAGGAYGPSSPHPHGGAGFGPGAGGGAGLGPGNGPGFGPGNGGGFGAGFAPGSPPGVTLTGGVRLVTAAEHPNYLKFFKMLKNGEPKELIRQKMLEAGLDASLLDKEFSDQVPFGGDDAANAAGDGKPAMVAAQDHPRYAQYFKMLKVGLPKQAVMAKMEQEGLDPNVILNPPDQMIPVDVPAKTGDAIAADSATAKAEPAAEETVPVAEHPKYMKFFKMLKIGLPPAAVKLKMEQEGVDPGMLDKPPDEKIPLIDKPKEAAEEKVPVSEHPKYAKFFKMLKVGLPPPAVKNKMTQEGVDPDMLDKDPSELIPLNDKPKEEAGAAEGEKVPIGEHPKYAKFFKMLKVGLPPPAVKNKMQQEGLDPAMLDKPDTELIPLNDAAAKDEGEKVPVSEHPKYAKYFKMLKVGLPPPAVKGKMQQEGVDPTMLDKDPSELIPLNDAPAEDEGPMVAVGEHPLYNKFFKMLKVGLPLSAVKMKVTQEGLDPSMLDKDPAEMVPVNPKPAGSSKPAAASGIAGIKKAPAGPKVTKKKLHWKALDRDKVKNSLWAEGGEDDGDLHMDEEEFKRLFVQTDSVDDKKAAEAKAKATKEVKKQKVSLINMKRAQNAGIALARIRYPYETLRVKIMDMDGEHITTDQLRSLEEFLPTAEEEGQVAAYKGDLKDLGQAEQYMKVMAGFKSAPKRLRCMIYKQVFKSRVLECNTKLKAIGDACDDLRMCHRLKKVLKTILRVGNQLNDGEKHGGFTLDSLLKLQSAKAFDRKTSVLQYVITLIHRNDPDCLRFPEDLVKISDASRLALDGIAGEKKGLRDEFDANFKIVTDIEENEPTQKTGNMVDFFVRAEAMCKELEAEFENVKKKFLGVLGYFGEDSAMTSTDFFSTLHKFVLEFATVRDAVERQRNAELKKAADALAASNAATAAQQQADSGLPPVNRRRSIAGSSSSAHRSKSMAGKEALHIDADAAEAHHRSASMVETHYPGQSLGPSEANSEASSEAHSPVQQMLESSVPSTHSNSPLSGDGISPNGSGKRRVLQRRKSSIM